MTIQPQKVQYTYDNRMQKVQSTYGQYNCKKYNTRMTIPLQKVQFKSMTIQVQKVQYTYDNATAKIKKHV